MQFTRMLALACVAPATGFGVGWPRAMVSGGCSTRRAPAPSLGLFDFLPGNQKVAPPPGTVRASHILFLKEADGLEEKKADTLLGRIKRDELTFGDAARGFSSCPSRDLNGDLGTFSSLGRLGEVPVIGELPYEGQDTSAFDDCVFSAETPLNVPTKVNSQWGTHLVLVEARGGGRRSAAEAGGAASASPAATAVEDRRGESL